MMSRTGGEVSCCEGCIRGGTGVILHFEDCEENVKIVVKTDPDLRDTCETEAAGCSITCEFAAEDLLFFGKNLLICAVLVDVSGMDPVQGVFRCSSAAVSSARFRVDFIFNLISVSEFPRRLRPQHMTLNSPYSTKHSSIFSPPLPRLPAMVHPLQHQFLHTPHITPHILHTKYANQPENDTPNQCMRNAPLICLVLLLSSPWSRPRALLRGRIRHGEAPSQA
jgi:hypothetical protein